MMEGVSSEAASLAGHLQLGNLCWIYDNNHITIEGNTALAFSEDVAARFSAYGWNVHARRRRQRPRAHRRRARRRSKRTDDRPTLIIVDSHIGYGAPHKQDTSAAHGEPLGEDEVKLTKRDYGWPEDAQFLVPDGVYEHFRRASARAAASCATEWAALFDALPQRAIPSSPTQLRAHAAARAARRLGRGHPGLPGRPQGHRHPRSPRARC